MLSPALADTTFRDVDTCRVVRVWCGRPNRSLTRRNSDFYTIHSPYYNYYSFK